MIPNYSIKAGTYMRMGVPIEGIPEQHLTTLEEADSSFHPTRVVDLMVEDIPLPLFVDECLGGARSSSNDPKRMTDLSESVERFCVSVKNIINDQLLEKEFNHHAIMKLADTIPQRTDRLIHCPEETIALAQRMSEDLNGRKFRKCLSRSLHRRVNRTLRHWRERNHSRSAPGSPKRASGSGYVQVT